MRQLFTIVVVCVIAGCTQLYKTSSPWEESTFRKASFVVYPNDVRADPKARAETLVAWPGILDEVVFDTSTSTPYVRMLIRHHYFGWTIDGTTRKYWLSPRGEGAFTATWPLKPEWDLSEMRKLILPGDMVIVYGYARAVHDGIVDLGQAEYVRHIPRSLYRTDVISYGRPGEPVESIGLGLP